MGTFWQTHTRFACGSGKPTLRHSVLTAGLRDAWPESSTQLYGPHPTCCNRHGQQELRPASSCFVVQAVDLLEEMLNDCDPHWPDKGHDSQEGNQREATRGQTEDEDKPQFDGRESHVIVGVTSWVMHRCRLSSGTRSTLQNGSHYSGNTQQDALQETAAKLDAVPHLDSSQRTALVTGIVVAGSLDSRAVWPARCACSHRS
jgi:hypothetical protein